MTKINLKMKVLKGTFAVCRLEISETIPDWIEQEDFYSITRTSHELSIVCIEKNIPENIKCERDWNILQVEGPLDFSLVGILSSLSAALARHGISIFAISTYDTDYILVKNRDLNLAKTILSQEGHQICS
ncbi:ACT domain-containing protein [uncultured Ilyobacter sp.]|uniref:ACT domain-containing protein n=1 Tax=uncultured Ilyobacter sp. TaxID=544433 RepID=UPI0029C6C56C|nr:ACT domain-containing protein [uncultured Ilyobacter sp.]